MDYMFENLRLNELVSVVRENERYFDEFAQFLKTRGYSDVYSFVVEADDGRAKAIISEYLSLESGVFLYDGIGRPYQQCKGRWFFLAWIFRDAPAQRLNPLVQHAEGSSVHAKKTNLLNFVRKNAATVFPDARHWDWTPISEVFISRLEGSRRALKGNLFEAIVRQALAEVFEENGIELKIGDKEMRIHDETYDVQVVGKTNTILIPVKTRETMGGGHALLFTRDIHKSVAVAENAGYRCIPIVIAESWGGDLSGLACETFIYIKANPNQIVHIQPLLREALTVNIDTFRALA